MLDDKILCPHCQKEVEDYCSDECALKKDKIEGRKYKKQRWEDWELLNKHIPRLDISLESNLKNIRRPEEPRMDNIILFDDESLYKLLNDSKVSIPIPKLDKDKCAVWLKTMATREFYYQLSMKKPMEERYRPRMEHRGWMHRKNIEGIVPTFTKIIGKKKKALFIKNDYFHCHPSLFKADQLNIHIDMLAHQKWEAQQKLVDELRDLEWEVYEVWDSELIEKWKTKKSGA